MWFQDEKGELLLVRVENLFFVYLRKLYVVRDDDFVGGLDIFFYVDNVISKLVDWRVYVVVSCSSLDYDYGGDDLDLFDVGFDGDCWDLEDGFDEGDWFLYDSFDDGDWFLYDDYD